MWGEIVVVMNDLLFVGVFVAFMVASFGYIRLCDRIVRADQSERTPVDVPGGGVGGGDVGGGDVRSDVTGGPRETVAS